MRARKVLLAVILLSLSFCFVSGAGYGEVHGRYEVEWFLKEALEMNDIVYMKMRLLESMLNYIMRNPTTFLQARFSYDVLGEHSDKFPAGVKTTNKVVIFIVDTRNMFTSEHGVDLLSKFKKNLEITYSFIENIATDMDNDVVAQLFTKEGIPLAYFYQGEYHLWEK